MSASSTYYLMREEKALAMMQDEQDEYAMEQDEGIRKWYEQQDKDIEAQGHFNELINPKKSPF